MKSYLVLSALICVILAFEDDEFYCKVDDRQFKICRKCPNLRVSCEKQQSKCECDNIELKLGKLFIVSKC